MSESFEGRISAIARAKELSDRELNEMTFVQVCNMEAHLKTLNGRTSAIEIEQKDFRSWRDKMLQERRVLLGILIVGLPIIAGVVIKVFL